jgi:gliding motility-associated lipoprotein GldH
VIYEEHVGTPSLEWKRDNVLKYNVDIKDPSSKYNVYIAVRHTSTYPYKNLKVNLLTNTPNEENTVKEYDLYVRDENNVFVGEGLGDIYDAEILIEENFSFSQAGKYSFSLEHLMSKDNISNIMEIGLVIKKAE